MSLPYLMKLQPDNIPGQVPYLRVPQPIVDRWSESLSTVSGFRVGVVWNNSQVPKFGDMRLRNVPLHELTTVFSVSGGSFVSLQRDEPSREMLHANGLPLTDCMDECFDFMDTAGIIQNLDLVISICTAVAHLAGALGKPVWLLNRFESEWRWMRNREDSVWYPSMRIFNQPQSRQWAPVIAQVSEALRTTIDKRH